MCRSRTLVTMALAMALGAVGAPGHGEDGLEAGASLTVEILGLESARGQVRIAVFDNEEDWLNNAVHATVVDLEDREFSWTFEEVREGELGIVVLHDRNANGKNDRNLIGIPKEPYGFSNNLRATFGPPKWSKAKFQVEAGENIVRIRVK